MTPDSWEALETQLQQLRADQSFGPFRPLLDHLEALVRARLHRESATLLQTVIRGLHDEQVKGGSARELAQKVAAGYLQPNWNVGNLVQTTREVVINIVNTALPELKLPEPGIPVDVVLVVMTVPEAAAVESGAAFVGHPEALRKEFDDLRLHLEASGFNHWSQRYGAERRLWQPFGGAATIEKHLQDALDTLNKAQELDRPLEVRFHDITQVTLRENRGILRHLRLHGCIVIIETASLRHPALLSALQRSLLDVFPGTSVLTLAPRNDSFELIRTMTHALQLRLEDSEFNQRRLDPLEEYACEELAALDRMPRWIISRVRHLCGEAVAQAGILGQMRR